MRSKKVLGTVLAAVLMAMCSRPPVASFDPDKKEYRNGDTMRMKNTSEEAFSYNWTTNMSTVQYSDKDPAIATNGAGNCLVTLTAFSSNGNKRSQASKNIVVLPGLGKLMFYTDDTTRFSMPVKVDGILIGAPSRTYTGEPTCNAAGCITTTITEGEHVYNYVHPHHPETYTVTITPNVCTRLKMH